MIDFNKPVMLDGGMGSMLIKTAGMPAGFPTEKLNLTDPRAVAEVHGAYIAAGSDVIFANTFGANPRVSISRARLPKARPSHWI